MTRGRVTVVGLGPAGADLLLPVARDALEHTGHRFVRTARHPAVDDLARAGIETESFDAHYETAPDHETLYRAITEALVTSAAEHGAVVYGVPGNPAIGERTVALLRERATAGDIDLVVVPGLSFAELAWARLGVDPMASGARVLDGQDLPVAAAGLGGAMLVAHCTNRLVLSRVKLALLEELPPDAPVTVLQRLGLPDEHVAAVALEDLDRAVEPDHLTSAFVDLGDTRVAGDLAALWELALRLRGPGGCPWDAEQTHRSLARYLLEEAYEVVEAIEGLPVASWSSPDVPATYAHLQDELGDLLYQVVFHAALAHEAGAFDLGDVARRIHDKLVHRHPHVFGDASADSADAVVASWERIKLAERPGSSVVESISPSLPSLLYAQKLLRKAAAVGLNLGTPEEAAARAAAALAELPGAGPEAADACLGELLAAAAVLARTRGIDGESALRGWAARFRDRFVRLERIAGDRGVDLHGASRSTVEELWQAAGT